MKYKQSTFKETSIVDGSWAVQDDEQTWMITPTVGFYYL